jgi:hypothetical protein
MPTPPKNSNGRRPDTKLPKDLVRMPDEVPREQWVTWPRKNEASHIWGIPERNLTAKCRVGLITVYLADDQSLRIDPAELTEHFGEQGSARASGRLGNAGKPGRKKNIDEELDIDDPYPGLLHDLRGLISDLHEDRRKVLDLVLKPAGEHVAQLLEDNARKTARITELEERWKQDQDRRLEEQALRQAWEIETQKEQSAEARRAKLMDIFEKQVPTLVAKWRGGPSVAEFLIDLPDETIELMLLTDMLDDAKKEQLKQAWEVLKPLRQAKARVSNPSAPSAPNGSPANGAAS